MARQYGTRKVGELKHPKNYIRQDMGSEEELRELARSFKKQPWYPIIHDLELVIGDGNRRAAGMLLEFGPDAEVPTCATDELVDESAKLEIQLESAIHTRGISPYEEFVGASRWLEVNSGATIADLAKRTGGRSVSMLSRILSLGGCIPAVVEQAAAGLIPVCDWPRFAACDAKQQQELLVARASGEIKNRDDLARAARKLRNGPTEPAPKVSRGTFVLDGASVSVAVAGGQTLSMDALIDHLTDLLRAAKASRDKNIGVKNFAAVLRDQQTKRGAVT
jgi:hypothetical protein